MVRGSILGVWVLGLGRGTGVRLTRHVGCANALAWPRGLHGLEGGWVARRVCAVDVEGVWGFVGVEVRALAGDRAGGIGLGVASWSITCVEARAWGGVC